MVNEFRIARIQKSNFSIERAGEVSWGEAARGADADYDERLSAEGWALVIVITPDEGGRSSRTKIVGDSSMKKIVGDEDGWKNGLDEDDTQWPFGDEECKWVVRRTSLIFIPLRFYGVIGSSFWVLRKAHHRERAPSRQSTVQTEHHRDHRHHRRTMS